MKAYGKTLFLALFSLASMSCSSTSSLTDGAKSPNAAIDNILARKSVRTFADKEVEDEKVYWMLKAAMAAPSGMDNRPWEFVVIKNRESLDALAKVLPYAAMLADVPMAIIVCGDVNRSSYWYLDCSTAAQNLLLAAESLELGAVWTAAFPYEDRMAAIKEFVSLPENVLPLCVIPVGYPNGDEQAKDKYDTSKIHWEKY